MKRLNGRTISDPSGEAQRIARRAPSRRRGWTGTSLSGLVLALLSALGCSVSQDGIPPPKNRVFLPEGGLVDGDWLYVVNSNSDLRYNNGTLALVRLRGAAGAVSVEDDRDVTAHAWGTCPKDSRYVPDPKAPHGCCWDFLDPNILNCDEQAYVKSDATVRIGSFGGRPQFHLTPNGRRLLLPVRGNSSISMVYVDETSTPDEGPRLICTGPGPRRCATPGLTQEPFAVCEEGWRINQFLPASNSYDTTDLQGLNIHLPEEPYGMAVDNFQQILYVGHLQSGLLSLIDLAAEPSPRLVTVFGAAVPPSSSGFRGITGLLSTAEGQVTNPIFVSSRFRPVVTSVLAIGSGPAPSCDQVAGAPSLGGTCKSSGDANDVACNGARDLAVVSGSEIIDTGFTNGAETRGIAFSADQSKAWVLQRNPPAVIAIDRSISPITSQPLDLPYASTEVCVNPAFMEAHQAADGLFLYVSCFDTGEIYVVDANQNRVRDVVEVGRGPAGIIFDQTGKDLDHGYVLGFGANNISVVDVAPGSPHRHRVIQRIGFPSQTPREFVP